ncbi:MAG: hypothetical protein RBT16_02510 [Desulfococcus multivorans]|jgi:hypothetical protein|uniref:hypothetical protein n=1 Tax=Desulfococcus sp. TaxID=2025834 RepID=UPI002A477C6F|nr:hypothetical protein [Desulfococcus multivorans]
MMNHGGFRKNALTGVMFLFLLCGLAGCSSLKGNDAAGSPAAAGPAPLYYDGFNDILIPGELKPDRDASSTFQSRGFAAGMMVFKGRVDRGSLVAFFKENMAKDNWKLTGSVSTAKTILLFLKETRWCVIAISEGAWQSKAEISVLPSVLNIQNPSSGFDTSPLPEGAFPTN